MQKRIFGKRFDGGKIPMPASIELHYLRTCHVDQIGLEFLDHRRTLHVGKIDGESNLVVQGKGKPERVLDFVSKGFRGKILFGCLGINRQDLDFVTGLGKKLEHFFESVGVSRDVCERGRFHHEHDLARWVAVQRRRIVRVRGLSQLRAASAGCGWRRCVGSIGRKAQASHGQESKRDDGKGCGCLHFCRARITVKLIGELIR